MKSACARHSDHIDAYFVLTIYVYQIHMEAVVRLSAVFGWGKFACIKIQNVGVRFAISGIRSKKKLIILYVL